jgi:hypothetical protein
MLLRAAILFMPIVFAPSVAGGQEVRVAATEFIGTCDVDSPLAETVRQHDGAKRVAIPTCGRALVIPGRQIKFFRKGSDKPVLVFTGHPGNSSDINLDQVAVDGAAPALTTAGRCVLYGNMDTGDMKIECFGVYRDGGEVLGAVAVMDIPAAQLNPLNR